MPYIKQEDRDKVSEGNIVTGMGSDWWQSPIKYSNWQCELFGGSSITWRPEEGKEPNWFWRWMQYLAFGNRWKKVK